MKFTATILNLVAVASAIDIGFHSSTDCSGGWALCSNWNPNTCCYGSGGSVAARGVPIGWKAELRGYTGGGCTALNQVIRNGASQSFICIRGGFFTGVGYNFYNRKRGDVDDAEAVDKSDCVRPDTLLLSDGAEYDLVGLDDDQYEALVPLAMKATSHEEVPEELKALRKEAN